MCLLSSSQSTFKPGLENHLPSRTLTRYASLLPGGIPDSFLYAARFLVIVVCCLVLVSCADEKTVSTDPAGKASRKSISVTKTKRSPTETGKIAQRSDKPAPRSDKPAPRSDKPAPRSAKPAHRQQSLERRGKRAKSAPILKKRASELADRKIQAHKDPETVRAASEPKSSVEKERQEILRHFRASRRVFKSMDKRVVHHRLSWRELRKAVTETTRTGEFSSESKRSSLWWIDFLENRSARLVNIFRLPYRKSSTKGARTIQFFREGQALLTPVQQSMWQHCKLNYENRYPGSQLHLVSGYRSPAYQAFYLSQDSGTLDAILQSTAPPFFSPHHKPVPDISVEQTVKADRLKFDRPKQLLEVCDVFGFREGEGLQTSWQTELSFVGEKQLYQVTLSNKIIPENLKVHFFKAMQRTRFYPSPEGMRVLFAISAQESSLSWNPRLNRPKKAELRTKFNRVLGTIEKSFGGAVSELFFSDSLNAEKKNLIDELERITDPRNRSIREYDFYLWTLKVSRFLNQLLQENRRLTSFGKWLFKIEQFADQIKYEPQTFGLWQINVNHLKERIEQHPQLRRRFPEIFEKEDGSWRVVRSRMIDVLSAMPGSVLDRQRTLELIIHTYLQPRYQSHLLGNKEDLTYFIAENVAGDMSTFRAAIQQELNNRIGSRLVLDGDLSFYQPYSTEINWKRPSNTQKAFRDFIELRYAYFSRPVEREKLVEALCEANTWEKLKRSELYRRIMRKKRGKRLFPDIKSTLYQQTPQSYAGVVRRKSKLF